MDPSNPVVKFCIAGMEAEGAGHLSEAQALFRKAWAIRRDDLDACIAAHFLARYQADPADALRWNQLALDHADAMGASDERVQGFYPSLHLNLGWSHEQLDNWDAARTHYELAVSYLEGLPASPYGDVVRRGVAMAQQRMHAHAGDEPYKVAKLAKVSLRVG